MNIFFSMILWFGCSDSPDPKPTKAPSYPVAEQADVGQFASDGRGTTENVVSDDGTILERHKSLGTVPQNAIALWIEAAIKAQQNNVEGWNALQSLTLPLKDDDGWKSHGRNTYFVKAITEDNPVFRSFVVGATPENNYAVDLTNIKIKVAYENKRDVRGRKFMIVSNGSSMPRPVYVKQSTTTNLFYITEYSSLYVDVQPAIDANQEQFK